MFLTPFIHIFSYQFLATFFECLCAWLEPKLLRGIFVTFSNQNNLSLMKFQDTQGSRVFGFKTSSPHKKFLPCTPPHTLLLILPSFHPSPIPDLMLKTHHLKSCSSMEIHKFCVRKVKIIIMIFAADLLWNSVSLKLLF